jgi:hypothetical protein
MVFNVDTGLEKETGYNPLMWSRPVEQPKGNQSRETYLKGIGEVGAEAADLFDKTQHQWLKESIFKEAEPIRERYQSMYENQLEELQQGDAQLVPPTNTRKQAQADLVTDSRGGSPFGGGWGVMPDQEKDQLSHKVEAIEGAKANGKLSLFHYYAELDTLAQKYRNQWPGEREFIDSVFNQFTGREVANRRLAAVMSDINSFAQTRAAGVQAGMSWFENEKVQSVLNIPAGDGSGRSMWDVYKTNFANTGNKEWLYAAQRAAQPALAADGFYQMQKNRLEADKLSKEDLKDRVHQDYSSWLVNHSTAQLNAAMGGGNTDFSKAIAAARAKQVPEREILGQVATELMKTKMQVLNDAAQSYNQPIAPGSSVKVRDVVPIEELQKDINAASDMFDKQIKTIYGGDLSLLTMSQILNKARAEDAQSQLMQKYPWMVTLQGMSALPKQLQDLVATQMFQQTELSGTQFAATATTIGSSVLGLHGAPDPQANIKSAIEAARNDGAKGLAIRDGLVTGFAAAGHKGTPDAQINSAIDQLVTPLTHGWLDLFSLDRTDPMTGGYIQGAADLYSRVYNPGFIENAKKVGRLDEVGEAASRDLSGNLFQKSFGEFQAVAQNQYPWIKVHWDDVNHQVHLLVDPNMDLSLRVSEAFPRQIPQNLRDAERNINMGLTVMSNIAKQKGEQNIDEFLAQAFLSAGADFSGLKYDTLGSGWVNAWLHSRDIKKKEDVEADKYREQLRGSAGSVEGGFSAGGGL